MAQGSGGAMGRNTSEISTYNRKSNYYRLQFGALGDLSFLEKRDRKGGFALSPLSLSRGLARLDHWNSEEIEKRASEVKFGDSNLANALPWQLILEKYKQSEQTEYSRVYTEDYHMKKGDDNTRQLHNILKNKVRKVRL